LEQPTEVAPLVAELNTFLDQNAANLERARRHVANLTHGLKTPLATLAIIMDERGWYADGRLKPLVMTMDLPVEPCSRLQHLQRPTPSHLGSDTPDATRRGDENMARGRRSDVRIPLANGSTTLASPQRDNTGWGRAVISGAIVGGDRDSVVRVPDLGRVCRGTDPPERA
jgi:hypothetical protein